VSDPASRYAATPAYRRRVDGLGEVELLEPRTPPPTPAAGHHRVAAGERLDHLAARLLDDPYAWWRLADANPAVEVEELDTAGRVLDLPERGA
jgi:hypothetical protein